MRVAMNTKIGGTRNGEEWPEIGGTIEVPDHEGLDLIAAGYAREANGHDPDRTTAANPPAVEGPEATDPEPEAGPDDSPPVKPRGRGRK